MEKEIKKFISYFFVGGMSAIVEWVSFAIFNLFLNVVHFCFSTLYFNTVLFNPPIKYILSFSYILTEL